MVQEDKKNEDSEIESWHGLLVPMLIMLLYEKTPKLVPLNHLFCLGFSIV